MVKIDHEKLNNCDMYFDSKEEIVQYFQYMLEYLQSHNKNYTKKQYEIIQCLYDIIQSLEIEY